MDKKVMKSINNIVIVLIIFAAIVLLVAILSGDKDTSDNTARDRAQDTDQVDEKQEESDIDSEETTTADKDEVTEDEQEVTEEEVDTTNLLDAGINAQYPGNVSTMKPFTEGSETHSFDAIEWLTYPEGGNTRVNFQLVNFSHSADGTPARSGQPFGTGPVHNGVCTPDANTDITSTADGTLVALIKCEGSQIGLFQDGKNLRLSENADGSDSWSEIRVVDMTAIRR